MAKIIPNIQHEKIKRQKNRPKMIADMQADLLAYETANAGQQKQIIKRLMANVIEILLQQE